MGKTDKKKTDKIYPKIDLRCSEEFKRKLEKRSLTYSLSPSQFIRMMIIYSFDMDQRTMMGVRSRYGQRSEVQKPK